MKPEVEKFNEWMLKIKNIYYSDNQRMLNAYNIVKNEK